MTQPFSPSAILFDLDGTLLDTARDLGNALNHVLTLNGLPTIDYDIYRNLASHGALGLLKLGFGDKIEHYDLSALRQDFLDYYGENLCVDTVVFDQATLFLKKITERNIPWGIVTNKPEKLTLALLPHIDIFKQCSVVVGGDTLNVAKPDPDPLLYAADQINIPPEKIWYLGDALRDIQAANSANMFSIIANYGYIDQSESPHNWQADMSVDHLNTLIQYL